MSKNIIEVKNLVKEFSIPHEKKESVRSYFLNPFHRSRRETFRAVDDISLNVKKGEFLGIIGRNGSGKSTLLKIISGIYAPTSGSVDVTGRLIPFLSLGVGFNEQLSGRENVFLNGTILGLTRKYIESVYDEIVDFAELGDFMDLQIKNYSSGMKVRLGFAIAMKAKADIFVLDEVLSVGDAAFRKKSLKKMHELLYSGATVLFVSHTASQVRGYCDRVVMLESGKKVYDGDIEAGLDKYQESLFDEQNITLAPLEEKRIESIQKKVEVEEIKVYCKGEETKKLQYGEKYKVELKLKFNVDMDNPWVGFVITNLPNYMLYGTRTNSKNRIGKVKAGQELTIEYTGVINLKPGDYTIKFKIADTDIDKPPIPWLTKVKSIEVLPVKGKEFWTFADSEIDYKFNIRS